MPSGVGAAARFGRHRSPTAARERHRRRRPRRCIARPAARLELRPPVHPPRAALPVSRAQKLVSVWPWFARQQVAPPGRPTGDGDEEADSPPVSRREPSAVVTHIGVAALGGRAQRRSPRSRSCDTGAVGVVAKVAKLDMARPRREPVASRASFHSTVELGEKCAKAKELYQRRASQAVVVVWQRVDGALSSG